MKAKTCMAAVLLVHAALAHADTPDPDDSGAYLSLAFGNGRIYGGNATGYRWMRGRTFEVRAGRQERATRIDFVHYNEGHPDNNHRDGFALQWLAAHRFSHAWTGELGAGPYLSMNTTAINGRQVDDARLGVLLSAGLRLTVPGPPGTHLRLGYNHTAMRHVHRSDALVLGLGRQFGPAEPAPEVVPDGHVPDGHVPDGHVPNGHLWFGGTVGWALTNVPGSHEARAAVLEARQYADRWGIGYKFLFEGDDGAHVDRRGVAGQVWYVQPVTPRLSMSAGLGPYFAANRRDGNRTATNLLVSFQAERALSARTRAMINFNRIKTFRKTNDRDLFQLGLLRRF